jgi:hypothetical protein
MDLKTALAVEVSAKDVGEVDSDLASCLEEASRSLHRATVALGCVESDRHLRPDGHRTSVPRGTRPMSDHPTTGSMPAQWDVQSALAYVETATDSIAVAARLAHLEPWAEATEGPGRLAVDQNTCPDGVDGTHRIDLQAQIGRELNRVVSHGIFEATLAINGALQYVCDPVAELRIEGAVEGIDETIRRFRTIVSMLENPDA